MRNIRGWSLILVFLAGVLPAIGQAAGSRPLDPSYLVDMPSVERVKAEIKGTDATDTLARQVSVLNYLSQYIQRIKYNRTVRGPYTPDEARIMGAYDLAAYQIAQDYGKAHTAAEADSFQRLHWKYDMDSDFGQDWKKRLIGPQTAAAYNKMETDLAAKQKAHYDQEMRDYQRDSAAQKAADKQIFGTQSLSNDPTAVATRRCLELGGSSLECVGKGFMSGLSDMMGMGEITSQLGIKERAGLVMVGSYNGQQGLSFMFGGDAVTVQGCGKLVPDSLGYSIAKKGDHLLIKVANTPRPFMMDWDPSGKITGPGPVDITGKVITGYRHYWVQQRYTADNTIVPGSAHEESEPIYADKTERCTVGTMTPVVINDSAAPMGGLVGEMLGAVVDKFVSKSTGPRMTGKFGSSSGLTADFSDDFVVLDCGQAHIKQPYAVENTANQILVRVQNSSGPFTIAMGPDNTLRGSGTTTINGRLVTGMRGDDVTFAPHVERCEVGSLAPASGTRSAAVAGLQATAAPVETARAAVAPAQTPAPTPVSAAAAAAPVSSPRAAMRIAITSAFPSGANPIAGQPVFLMRERMDEVLRKLGFAVPPNASPGKAMEALAASCHTSNCGPMIAGMNKYFVGMTKLDAAGKAGVSAQMAPGSYFVYAIVKTPTGSMMWDVPANLTAGDNAVTLSAANAEVIH